MNDQNQCLPDGEYECNSATLIIKDGKAMVVLQSAFGLKKGVTIPLLRPENNIVIGGEILPLVEIFNGHAII